MNETNTKLIQQRIISSLEKFFIIKSNHCHTVWGFPSHEKQGNPQHYFIALYIENVKIHWYIGE